MKKLLEEMGQEGLLEYSFEVDVKWSQAGIEATNDEEALEKLKATFVEEFGFEPADNEIKIVSKTPVGGATEKVAESKINEEMDRGEVQQEIIAILADTLENEIVIMGNDYTVAEVAQEVLSAYAQKELGMTGSN